MSRVPRENCPDQELLQELAAGIGSPELAQRTMQHVARCSTCAAALQRYIREFSPEQSPEDIAILNQLKSSRPDWQKKLVREQLGGKKGFRWLKLAPAGVALAAAVLAAFAGPTLLLNFKVMQANKQVAAAFAERRTTEMRLTSVEYSPYNGFPVTLGPEGGRGLDEVPTSLHEASGAANKNLQSSHADPRWLQIQGRALLWESTPSSLEKAEKDFEKAKSAGMSTPSLEIDLAVSYYERDSRTEHPNLQRTLNLLSEVLSKPGLNNDDRASALYDLAIAYEKTQAWDLAVSTWEKYLAVDSTSAWAGQARTHLKEGKEKTSTRQQQSYSDPSFFLQQKAQGSLKPEDPEQYQQKALTVWLPIAVADRESDAYRALNGLAEVFAEHQDFWWRDFLRETSPRDLDAVRDLSDAITSNEQGSYDQALTKSRAAAKRFVHGRNISGQMIARLQEIYALRSKLEGANCLSRAGPLIKDLSQTQFIWLRAQSLLERAQCRNFQMELAESDEDSSLSLQLTKKSLPVLKLRVLGISAGIRRLRGEYAQAWELGVEGLQLYWKGAYPPERLDQFYAVMLQGAEDSNFPYLAEAMLRQILDSRERPDSRIGKNLIREGMLHLELANLLRARQDSNEAEKQAQMAAAILENAAHAYPVDYEISSNLRPAENDLRREEAVKALATLNGMRGLVERTQHKELALDYYRLLGNVHLRLRHLDEAATSFESAIEIANAALESLKSADDRISWKRATEESYRGEVRVLLAQGKERKALERWEQYKSWPLLSAKFSAEAAAVPNTSKALIEGKNLPLALPPSVGVRLVYAGFPDGVQIWVLKRDRLHSSWVDIRKQNLEDQVRLFAEQCATPDSSLSELNSQGLKLYSLLVQPVATEFAESQSLIVELDDAISGLSLEGLKTPGGRYFGERYSIVYSPGVWMEQHLRIPGPIRASDSLLLLDATHSPGAGFLPGMEAERRVIAKAFAQPIVVDAANVNWLDLRSRLAASDIFHYMGHGRPSRTGTDLMLNQNQSLGAGDVSPDAFARSELVVLAACSSGKGSEKGLLDTQNLVHSFLAAGVPRIVASHWDVDSESTSRLMISFYQHVMADQTAAQAMLNARREVQAEKAHPYYWAGFSVTGRVN
jgi:CHAT domain-containing protein